MAAHWPAPIGLVVRPLGGAPAAASRSSTSAWSSIERRGPAESDRVVHPGEAGVVLGAQEHRRVGGGRRMALEQRVDRGGQRGRVGCGRVGCRRARCGRAHPAPGGTRLTWTAIWPCSCRAWLSYFFGYALAAFFFAYQAAFYVVAARFGAWSPADVPYSDMLNTAFPWATVLLIGFLPAVSEEGISRMFSISFLDRLGAGRFLAVVVPAFIWGFGHAGYPNQPFYIRGLEVGLAGVLIGFLMLRFGVVPLLVWHFTVDAVYTALLLLRSGNTYYVASGAIAAGILLLPLLVSLVLYWKRGGFLPSSGLRNGDRGFVPTPAPPPPALSPVPDVRPLSPGTRIFAAAAALFLVSSFFVPTADSGDPLAEDRVGRVAAEAMARRFLRANGVDPDPWRSVAYLGAGFADDEELRAAKPQDEGGIPGFSDAAARYVIDRGGPAAFRKLAANQLADRLLGGPFLSAREERGMEGPGRHAPRAGRGFRESSAGRRRGGTAPVARGRAPPGGGRRGKARLPGGRIRGPGSRHGESAQEGGHDRRPRGQAPRPRRSAAPTDRRLPRPPARVLPPLDSGARDVPARAAEAVGSRVAFDGRARRCRGGAHRPRGHPVPAPVRQPDFRWASTWRPLAVAGVLAAAGLANTVPYLFRQYATEMPMALFQLGLAVSLTIGVLGILLVALVGFVLCSGARPGWARALRRKGSLGDALLRAALAAAGLVGLSRWFHVISSRVASLYDPDPSLPSSLQYAVPGLDVLWTAGRGGFALAAMAATAVMAWKSTFFRTTAGRTLGILAVLVAMLPSHLHSPGEFVAEYLPGLLIALWLAVAAFGLLRDHAAAWALFGLMAFGGRAALEVLVQPAAADQAAGGFALVLLALAGVALLAGRRDRVVAAPPPPPPPDPAPTTPSSDSA